MIPIIYDKEETGFTSNGLGRLRDCISCVVTEERNGIYECDLEYPTDGANYELIQCGRIIGVTHDETGDIQPFDIVSYNRPIDGVVTFHCVHISYRQTALTVSGTNINSLSAAFTMLGGAVPSNPFTYTSDKASTGFLAAGDNVPHSVRSILGGMEGSILDAYGGEYEWDKWNVILHENRGTMKDFTIRYGVNLTEFTDEMDYTDTYTSVVPYWVGQDADGNDTIIKGDMQSASYPSFNGTGRCIPLDVTDKFNSEDGQPTKAQVEAQGLAYINANQPFMPAQNIQVDFFRISDTSEYDQFAPLQTCSLCDTINVIFSEYGITGTFKIVKTEWDVLQGKYNKLELGGLSITLSQALGINAEASNRLRVASGGTTNYNELTNKPSVNGVTLSGNKTTNALNIGTVTPAASEVSKFDASACMNSTDMTTAQVDTFVDGLSVVGHAITIRQEKTTVSIPSLSARAYTAISITPPAVASGEQYMGNRIIVFDAAHQATLRYYNGGWYLNVFNAYNGTAGANTAEVWWLIIGGLSS